MEDKDLHITAVDVGNTFYIAALRFNHLTPLLLLPCLHQRMIFYRSLPPVSKTFGVACLMTTSAFYLQLFSPGSIYLDYGLVFKKFQSKVWCHWREDLLTRELQTVWMLIFGAPSLLVMSVVPFLWSPFMGNSVVFMIVYVWSRKFPNARISVYGLVSFKGFYLAYVMLALDLLLGNPLKPDILGIVAGHLYYFLTVLHPLADGKMVLITPLWVHRVVAYWGEGTQFNAPVRSSPHAGVAFQGRGFRLNGNTRRATTPEQPQTNTGQQPNNQGDGVAFRGRGRRLDGRLLVSFLAS